MCSIGPVREHSGARMCCILCYPCPGAPQLTAVARHFVDTLIKEELTPAFCRWKMAGAHQTVCDLL